MFDVKEGGLLSLLPRTIVVVVINKVIWLLTWPEFQHPCILMTLWKQVWCCTGSANSNLYPCTLWAHHHGFTHTCVMLYISIVLRLQQLYTQHTQHFNFSAISTMVSHVHIPSLVFLSTTFSMVPPPSPAPLRSPLPPPPPPMPTSMPERATTGHKQTNLFGCYTVPNDKWWLHHLGLR
jgi:hypothetical protein